jgi:putative ABC transport system permease protein
MAFLRQLLNRLWATTTPGRSEDDLAREIRAHLTLLEDKFTAQGMASEDAKLAARRAFGGVEQAKEHQRDTRAFRWIDDLRRDFVYAVRSLSRTPAFTAASLLTLAVGIGVTTTIYSVVDRVLLQPLAFPDGDRLIRVVLTPVRGGRGINFQEYQDWRSRTKTLSSLAAVSMNLQQLIQTPKGMVRLSGGFVSFNYFEVLGETAAIGRPIESSDRSNPDVVVLSHAAWQNFFGGDPHAIGLPIEVRGGTATPRLLTVVGVLPDVKTEIALDLDFYAPIVVPPGGRPPGVGMIGRLADGVSVAVAAEEANVIGTAIRPLPPDTPAPPNGPLFTVTELKDGVVKSLRPALSVFLAAVGVVLLIVCANLANLLLARGTSRSREFAVRLAIGASRGRIVRQMLAECLVLTVAGALLGALLAAAGLTLVKQLAFIDAPGIFRLAYGSSVLPRSDEIGVDLRMLAIAFSVAAITGVLFGILPAIHLFRTNQLQAMGTRGTSSVRGEARMRSALVVGQMVMATVLLVGAGLLIRSFVSLLNTEKGYDATNVLGFNLVLPSEYSTERKSQTVAALLGRVRSIPTVTAAGFSYSGVLLGIEDTVGTLVPAGRTLEQMQADAAEKPHVRSISPGFLQTMGIRVIAGRDFNETDNGPAPPVIALDKATSRKYFGDANPIGSHIDWHGGKGDPVQMSIIAVVDDVKNGSVANAAEPQFYVDYRQMVRFAQQWQMPKQQVEGLALGFLSFNLRSAGDPSALIPDVRTAVHDVDSLAGLDAILPLDHLFAATVARQRFYAVMLGVFAGVAGLLAAIGIYGVLAYAVVQRTQEIGVRMALGAQRGRVLALVLRQGLTLTASGVVLGLGGAALGTKYLQALLYGLTPLDPGTFIGVAVAFAGVAALASFLPARRATKVDPVIALRAE